MKKFIVALMLVASSAFAQSSAVGPRDANLNLGPVLKGQDLQAARSFVLSFPKAEGWSLLTLFFDVTDANDSVTTMTMACYSEYAEMATTFTSITRAQCSTDTMTVTVNGTDYSLVENTDWLRGATDATAASALGEAIQTKTGGLVTAEVINNNIHLHPAGGAYSLWVASSDSNCATAGNGDARSALQSGSPLVGVMDSYDAAWHAHNAATQPLNPTGAGGLHKKWPWRVDIANLRQVKCVVTPTGGAAADLITVNARLSVR